jgi:hypothetical protein
MVSVLCKELDSLKYLEKKIEVYAVLLQRITRCTLLFEDSMVLAEVENKAHLHIAQDVNRAVRELL